MTHMVSPSSMPKKAQRSPFCITLAVIFENSSLPMGNRFYLFPLGFNHLSSSIVTNTAQFHLFNCRYFAVEIAIKSRNLE